jgi:propionate CoA-transferase
VFALTGAGLELIEIAPGVDLEKDILAHMEFRPVIKGTIPLMDQRIFKAEPMGLKADLMTVSLSERLTYDPQENFFFVNFEGYSITTREDIREVKTMVEKILSPAGKKVYTIVNYDNFNILPDLVDEYSDMVKGLVERFYSGVTRYTTSTFLRMKIGDALEKRDVAPHIYESREEAQRALRKA